MWRRLVARYSEMVVRSPYLTNCGTGFVIAAVGDYVSQRHFEQPPQPQEGQPPETGEVAQSVEFLWNSRRTAEMGLIRASVITPFVLKWYPFLAAVSPGSTVVGVGGRILLDQFVGSPVVIFLVFVANSVLSGDWVNLERRVRDHFFATWRAGAQYWPFVHCINFGFIPLPHQPLFAHFASVYWNAVLSYYSNIRDEGQMRK